MVISQPRYLIKNIDDKACTGDTDLAGGFNDIPLLPPLQSDTKVRNALDLVPSIYFKKMITVTANDHNTT